MWLAINNLAVDPRARAKYNLDEYRRDRLLGLKRYLNELLFDQLPVLKVRGWWADRRGGRGALLKTPPRSQAVSE